MAKNPWRAGLIPGTRMHRPRISIVTPSYNQAQYIGWTVRSVLHQRYPNLEYILMDGGSTDGTQRVLEPYADRFAHYSSEKDNGQSDAVARGFARSTGQIMAYLNSDDMLAPGALQFVADFFAQHPKVDAIYSHRCTVDDKNKAISYWILPTHSSYLMKRWDLIPQETCFWRRSLFEKCGNIDPQFRFALDYDLFLRYMMVGRFVRVNRFLGAFRYHSTAKTATLLHDVGQSEIRKVREKHGLRIHKGESMLGGVFSLYVQRKGFRYQLQHKSLPGALPGVGYDYDAVWG
ncbi:MAG TPA: glycosyltransferase family 2 protein, partial [Verrucomicrobiae bacterium]|nr:glycosyltransferase family 2 protein [Verrucomicrobiae bacterium]